MELVKTQPHCLAFLRAISFVMVFMKFITAMVCLFAFTFEVSACQFAPNTPSSEMGDNLYLEGNVIFVGVVIDHEFEQVSNKKSCMAVRYQTSEMLFGSKSESFSFKIYGAGIPQSSDSDEFQHWAEIIAIGIGNEALVGLTKEAHPNAQKNISFESEFRPTYALCFPMVFRLDQLPDDARKNILGNYRKKIHDQASM